MSAESRDWAPIALFIYRRPDHLRRTIASLRACAGFSDSPLYVYADGPRTPSDNTAVLATREAARGLLGSRATFVERDGHHGLANSIIEGVTDVCDRHGRVVVVEDDLVLAPRFLVFLNDGLERYEREPRVMQVAGHMFEVPSVAEGREALFLPMTTSWGWATWKRAWNLFDPSATGWRERLVGAEAERFDLSGTCDYSGMLRRQMSGGIDSWAICWYYSVFVHHGLVLYPPRTMAFHAGTDGSGTHGRLVRRSAQGPRLMDEAPRMPDRVAVSPKAEDVFAAVARASRRDLRGALTGLVRSQLAALALRKGG